LPIDNLLARCGLHGRILLLMLLSEIDIISILPVKPGKKMKIGDKFKRKICD
jgi:hypothetical protein